MTKLLLLEDNEEDAELAMHYLPPDVQASVVRSRRDYETALAQHDWNLIITDFSIPGYSGIDAAKLAHQRWPDIPVLVLSGTLRDEMIPPLEDAGVNDVLLKDRPHRLPWAIRRALRERATQSELLRRQRVQIIGEMAAGFVHDLRNMLAIVSGALFLFQSTVPENKRDFISRAQNSIDKILQMVDRLMVFVSGSNGQHEAVDVRMVILEWLQFLPGMFPSVEIVSEVKTQTIMPIDPTLLRQIITNFCSNARDAGANRIEVIAEDVELNKYRSCFAKPDQLFSGRYCVLRAKDNGSGVPPEILPNIVEAFFTTKTPDKGTGLGLATIRNITELYSGFVDVETQIGHGSTFSAFLRLPEQTKSA